MGNWFKNLALALTMLLAPACCATGPAFVQAAPQDKKHDLVLVHGLANKHRWSDAFLDACLSIWGSGNVYAVYTNDSTRVWEREIRGKKLICMGEDDFSAGKVSLERQAGYLARDVKLLQASHGLSRPFDIMAHSMGGLVSRGYIQHHPNMVAGLVTLGTPHHGSPLADSFKWLGYFLGADEAIEDLKPARAEAFNQACPVSSAPLAPGGRIYTIRGNCPGGDCVGWGGELALGWQVLHGYYEVENDGLVPWDSAVIKGAEHLADYPAYDHLELVTQPEVALKAARYLP